VSVDYSHVDLDVNITLDRSTGVIFVGIMQGIDSGCGCSLVDARSLKNSMVKISTAPADCTIHINDQGSPHVHVHVKVNA
jgi:hypothetical protein